MDRFVVVPGWTNSGERNWQTQWQRAWGADAERIEVSSWDEPELDDWLAGIDRAATHQRDAGADRIVLLGHSLGTWAAAQWAATRRPADAVLFLVAVPDPEGPNFPEDAAPSFHGLAPGVLPVPGLVVASDDDPYCTPERSRGFAASLGLPWTSVGGLGHVNSDSDLGMWPQGRRLLDDLLARAASEARRD